MIELVVSLACCVGPPPAGAGRPLPALVRDLKSADRNTVEAALRALEAMGPKARPALPDVLEWALESRRPSKPPEARARKAISAIGLPSVEEARARLDVGISGGRHTRLTRQRAFALRALAWHGPAARPASAQLVRELGLWDDRQLRGLAERQLARQEDMARWKLALFGLLRVGRSAVPELIAAGAVALREAPALTFPIHAAGVVAFGPAAVPALRGALRGEDEYRFRFAALVCKVMGAQAAGALPELQAEAKVTDGRARGEQKEAREAVEYQLYLARAAGLPGSAAAGHWPAAGMALVVPDTAPPAPREPQRSLFPGGLPTSFPASDPAGGAPRVGTIARLVLLAVLAIGAVGGWLGRKKKEAKRDPPPPDTPPRPDS